MLLTVRDYDHDKLMSNDFSLPSLPLSAFQLFLSVKLFIKANVCFPHDGPFPFSPQKAQEPQVICQSRRWVLKVAEYLLSLKII